MVEATIDCVRRGFFSFVALWPLLLVRLVESIVIMIVIVGGGLLSLIPIGVSLAFDDIETWVDDPEYVAEWLLSNVGTVAYLFVAVLILAGIAVLIHSYFEAGVASTYLDYIRSGSTFTWREGWDRFSLDTFTQAALSRGWSVFLVYNIVWGVAGGVLLIPLGLMLAVLLVFRDSPAAIGFTCLGLVFVFVVGILASIVATVWAQVALTLAAGERRGPVEASGLAGELMRARLGVTILTLLIVYAVIIGISSVTSTANIGLSVLAEMPGAAMVALAFQAVLFLVNSVVSTVLGLWKAAVWAVFVGSAAAPSSGGGNVGSGQAVVG
jgi:hypothetical protein